MCTVVNVHIKKHDSRDIYTQFILDCSKRSSIFSDPPPLDSCYSTNYRQTYKDLLGQETVHIQPGLVKGVENMKNVSVFIA